MIGLNELLEMKAEYEQEALISSTKLAVINSLIAKARSLAAKDVSIDVHAIPEDIHVAIPETPVINESYEGE